MEIFIPVMIGSIVGWVAGLATQPQSFGMVENIILGIIGGVTGSTISTILGFSSVFDIWKFFSSIAGASLLTTYVHGFNITFNK